jgi:hypothetical protein
VQSELRRERLPAARAANQLQALAERHGVTRTHAESDTCARCRAPSLQIVCCIYANPCCAKSRRFLAAARGAAVTLPQLHPSGNP